MANQDIIQLPFKVTSFSEDALVALNRNFSEIERYLSILQLYMKQTGKVLIDNSVQEGESYNSVIITAVDGIKVLDNTGTLRCHLGQYETGKYGLKLIAGSIEADALILNKTAFTVNAQLDGFGDGSDGDFSSTENVTIPVVTEDASSVIKQYSSFTLNAGHTLTTDKRCRGLFIFCQGDVTINGTINMNGKSGKVSKENSAQRILQIPVGVYAIDVPPGGTAGNGGSGGPGADDETPQRGKGGTGGSATSSTWFGGGFGGAGGGAGGGRGNQTDRGGYDGGNAGTSNLDNLVGAGGIGGAFLNAGSVGGNLSGGGGGSGGDGGVAGGGGGAGVAGGGGGYMDATAGASSGGQGGGLIVIIAKGNITIGSGAIITANGLNGGVGGNGADGGVSTGDGGGGGGQGGGGGGVVVLAYGGSYSNAGSITVNGGTGGAGGAKGTGGTITTYPATNGVSGSNGTVGTIILAEV